MSLIHRVNSNDSFSKRSRATGDDASGRRLSYNPVGEWVPAIAQKEPVGAYEVAKGRRIGQVAAAVTYCLFAAGIVFGYAALKPVLIQEGVYRDRCTKKELKDNVRVCYGQGFRLNVMFAAAAVATNVCALPTGTVLDRYGPRITGYIGCACLAIGCLLLGFASDIYPVDGYIPGYLFLALGGPFVFISSFHLSNAFPKYSGLILAMLTGAFDSSSAIFMFYRLLFTVSGRAFGHKAFFLSYLIVPVAILIIQVFLMPAKSYKTVSELVANADDSAQDEHDSDQEIPSQAEVEAIRETRRQHRESVISEITNLLGSTDGAEQSTKEDVKRANSGVWGALHGQSAWAQIRTPWFILVTLFSILQMLRINYFVATIRSQYTYLLRSHSKATDVNHFFDVALPAGGLLAVPFVGLILDNTSTPFVLALLVSSATVIGVLGVLPYTWAAYANVVLFVLYRPFYYTAVSDYSAKVFGFVTFGKVYGLVICLAGILNFLQAPLDATTHTVFNNNPVPVNIILLVATAAVGALFVGYVWIRSYRIERERLEREAEAAQEVLVPYHDEHVHEDHHTTQETRYGTADKTGPRRHRH